MPGQWEFQIGPVGPLELGDEVMLARWLLHRLGEDFGISSTFDPKPVKGDWNGTGAHTNYSTESMRNPGGMDVSGQCQVFLCTGHASGQFFGRICTHKHPGMLTVVVSWLKPPLVLSISNNEVRTLGQGS